MKKLLQFHIVRLPFVAVTLLFGCSSGPQLQKYPRREIDRPYTLPHGVATWQTPSTFRYIKDDSGATLTQYPIPNPLNWDMSVAESDDWNILFRPLPFAASHQFLKNDHRRLGMALTGGVGYGSDQGFMFNTGLNGNYREKLSEDSAIDFNPSFTGLFAARGEQTTRWIFAFSAGPLFQLSDFFALMPKVNFQFYRDITWINVSGISGYAKYFKEPEGTHFFAELGLSGVWSIHRQWDIKPAYAYGGFFSESGIQSHVGTVEFVYFW